MTDFYDEYDEFSTPEEKEMEYQRKKKVFEAMDADRTRYDAEKQLEAAQAEQNQIFADALKESGLDQETFNELVRLDPQGTRQAFTEHVKSYVGKIARRRDSRGRFLPGKPQSQGQQQPQKKLSPVTEASKLAQANRKQTDGKYYDGKGMHTTEDITDALVDIIGEDDSTFDM